MYQTPDEKVSNQDMLYIIIQFYRNGFDVYDLNKNNIKILRGEFDHTRNLGHILSINWEYIGLKTLNRNKFNVYPGKRYTSRVKIAHVRRYIRSNRLDKLLQT